MADDLTNEMREQLTEALNVTRMLDDPEDLSATLDAVLMVMNGAAVDRMANQLLEETNLRSMDFRNGATMEIEPARAIAANFVGAARAMLGDAPNYSETIVEMDTGLAGQGERFTFVVQRVGKLTPHQARQAAEAELERLRGERPELNSAELQFLRDLVGGSGTHVWGDLARHYDLDISSVEAVFSKLHLAYAAHAKAELAAVRQELAAAQTQTTQHDELPPGDLTQMRTRIDRASSEVHAIAENCRDHWRMTIPARPDHDSDLVIDAGLSDGLRAIDEVVRLRQLAGEILSHFTQPGHPGEPCRRTNWVPEHKISAWRDAAGRDAATGSDW